MFERHAIASDLLSPGNNQKTIEPCPSDEGLIPAGDRMALPIIYQESTNNLQYYWYIIGNYLDFTRIYQESTKNLSRLTHI